MIKIKNLLAIGLLAVIFWPLTGRAQDEISVLSNSEVINGNYYAAAPTVQVAGQVMSDVVVAGSVVEISGEVGGDVLVLGGTVRVTGHVHGNIRGLAGTLVIVGQVDKNVLVAVGTLRLDPSGEIQGQVTAAAVTTELNGKIGGSLLLQGGVVNLNGLINGPAQVYLGKDGSLNVGDQAILTGAVSYYGTKPANFSAKAQLASPARFYAQPIRDASSTGWWHWLVKFFSVAVLGMVLIKLVPKFISQIVIMADNSPVTSLVKGLIWLVVTPLAIIILLVTIIGWPLALLLSFLYVAGFLLAQVFVGLIFGWWLKSWPPLMKPLAKWSLLSLFLLGLLVYRLLAVVPYVGGLVVLLGSLLAWGALWQVIRGEFAVIK